jgi:hypothetical protein
VGNLSASRRQAAEEVPFPSSPWQLVAQAWLSVFVLRSGAGERPAGVYGVAFVDYQDGGILTYHELLVARLLRQGPSLRLRITDIWVDSPASRAGGRALWAIPKELADLPLEERVRGPVRRTTVSGVADGQLLATGTFTSVPGAAIARTPYAVSASQVREDGAPVVTPMRGSARPVPCRAAWRFAEDGPLGYLHGRRPVLSLRLCDVRLRFG